MNVALIHVDGKFPNLALMKLSTLHKQVQDAVQLIRMRDYFNVPIELFNMQVAYASVVFTQKTSKAKIRLLEEFDKCMKEKHREFELHIGGSGYSLTRMLPLNAEHMMPDYSLYGIDYSMGFFSRGCIRACPWCIVPEKEGKIQKNADITEFLHPSHKKLILFDGNLLACSQWQEALEFIVTRKLKVNFSQGLDIRLVDAENAKWLSKVHAYTWTFKTPMIHFAFDDVNYESEFQRGVATLTAHGVKPSKLTAYLLCGYPEKKEWKLEDDMYRFNILRELGVNPYVMKYQDRKDIPLLNAFDRWVNYRLYTKCSFDKYNRLPNKECTTEQKT